MISAHLYNIDQRKRCGKQTGTVEQTFKWGLKNLWSSDWACSVGEIFRTRDPRHKYFSSLIIEKVSDPNLAKINERK